MGSCAAPSAKGDDKFITTDYLQQCLYDYGMGVEPDADEANYWYDLAEEQGYTGPKNSQ